MYVYTYLESCGDPVVLAEEDGVHGGQCGLLTSACIAALESIL
jgi:hypothetical protein